MPQNTPGRSWRSAKMLRLVGASGLCFQCFFAAVKSAFIGVHPWSKTKVSRLGERQEYRNKPNRSSAFH